MFSKVIFSYAALAAILSTMANADCSGAQRVNGRLRADCHDEITGYDFEYVDIADRFAIDDDAPSTKGGLFTSNKVAPADRDWNKEISDHWHRPGRAASNTTANAQSLNKRGVTYYFNSCLQGIAGMCSSDHAVAYAGVAIAFTDAIMSIVSEVNTNKREAKIPRSICYLSKEIDGLSDKLCVSWAYNDLTELSQEQITDIGILCTNNCQKFEDSCEVRVVNPDHHNYYCVSDRPKGCTGNNGIMTCVI